MLPSSSRMDRSSPERSTSLKGCAWNTTWTSKEIAAYLFSEFQLWHSPLAAKIPRSQGRYLREQLLPQVDDQLIRLIGEVDDRHKAEFLANARALLFLIDWPEPFGLVMIEAMA